MPPSEEQLAIQWLVSMRDWFRHNHQKVERLTEEFEDNEGNARYLAMEAIGLTGRLAEAAGRYASFFSENPDAPGKGIQNEALQPGGSASDPEVLPKFDYPDYRGILGYGGFGYLVEVGLGELHDALEQVAVNNQAAAQLFLGFIGDWYTDLPFNHAWWRLKHNGGILIIDDEEIQEQDLQQMQDDLAERFEDLIDRVGVVNYNQKEGLVDPHVVPLGDRMIDALLRVSWLANEVMMSMIHQRIYALRADRDRIPPAFSLPSVAWPDEVEPWSEHLEGLEAKNINPQTETPDIHAALDWIEGVEEHYE